MSTTIKLVAVCAAAILAGSQASAAVVVVEENPVAPEGNFGTPTNQARVGYTIELGSDADNVTGVLTTTNPNPLPGANLYFDLDFTTPNRSGSDLGFELKAPGQVSNAFVPTTNNSGGSALLPGIATTFANGVFTFAIPKMFFTTPIAGLNYSPDLVFGGSQVRLNLSQSFSFSVAGGSTFYGTSRLGIADISNVNSAVPEPATWAMMLLGFGAVGYSMRSRRARRHQAQVA